MSNPVRDGQFPEAPGAFISSCAGELSGHYRHAKTILGTRTWPLEKIAQLSDVYEKWASQILLSCRHLREVVITTDIPSTNRTVGYSRDFDLDDGFYAAKKSVPNVGGLKGAVLRKQFIVYMEEIINRQLSSSLR